MAKPTVGELDWGPVLNDYLDTLMVRAANLADVTSVATARTNLGLGTAAVANTGDFQPHSTDLDTLVSLSDTAYGRAILELANQAALMALLSAATTTEQGKVELATNAEATTGTDATRAVTPAALAAVLAAYTPGGGGADTLDELTDVVITTPATGHILRHNGTNFVNALGSTHFQPADADLDALVALTQTGYGRAFLALADQTALMALVQAASETVAGKAELATQAETDTGTDDTRVITPLKFQTRMAAWAQPVDADLTAIAALTTTSYGRAFLALANQAALMALLSASSATAQGIVELATSAEAVTGTDTARAVTPAGLLAALVPAGTKQTVTIVKSGGVWAARPAGYTGVVIWEGADPDPTDPVAGDARLVV